MIKLKEEIESSNKYRLTEFKGEHEPLTLDALDSAWNVLKKMKLSYGDTIETKFGFQIKLSDYNIIINIVDPGFYTIVKNGKKVGKTYRGVLEKELKKHLKQGIENYSKLIKRYATIQLIQFKQFVNSNESKPFTSMYGGKNNYFKLVKKILNYGGNRVYVESISKASGSGYNNVPMALIAPNVNYDDSNLLHVPPKYLIKL